MTMELMPQINIDQLVSELFEEPICGAGTGDYDAREILAAALKSYHDAVINVPDALKPHIARAVLDCLALAVSPQIGIFLRDAQIPELLYTLIEEYNQTARIYPLPSNVLLE